MSVMEKVGLSMTVRFVHMHWSARVMAVSVPEEK